ncbi:antibiotic biosynthesis monooxygenase [Erwinia sp. OLTSP20]|uniref:putative quinol monooxygenase n=1 Tax=unclassified Erwinia TaxID=2622719 RepID=UPI000C19EB7C|nr:MULTISPECIES: putative quinol monooxygenase [unclassified Erwinia]PIJ49715.1 antibiotic biosynthesis monooxygenase [Erwinia sp. OAMSP11]PIJ70813.1 antibiotic biosynthesis monooxygenase [Erwinia sp. OLSSP12]PIJ80179.1 antibiotic biosynthesis monooxygenase [Erwinia sp. OLCASP19]PIJ82302.1 antibiotic biosynthesis monooxygenase [Erwinia sp. OLMTSP26]PIJ84989.1 antibiotic biosynthesis monooxygenase [Erwinia sp. OLMDSP33]
MLTVIAEICVHPGQRARVIQAIEHITPTVLNEEGCSKYQLLVDHVSQVPWKQHSPHSIFMLEHWESLRHLEKHQQAPHMEAHRANIKDDVIAVKIFVLQPVNGQEPASHVAGG